MADFNCGIGGFLLFGTDKIYKKNAKITAVSKIL
jgi:hypothetical protein